MTESAASSFPWHLEKKKKILAYHQVRIQDFSKKGALLRIEAGVRGLPRPPAGPGQSPGVGVRGAEPPESSRVFM